jgi:plastocyanin
MPPCHSRRMTIIRGIGLAATLAGCAPLAAATLDVQVSGADGRPVADTVVTVHLVGQPTPPVRIGTGYAIDQQNIQFHPFVAVVPVGARVSFLNHDPVRHHVYSFSPAKTFELKLEKRQEDRAVVFDKAGIVPLGCNIHDTMIAYIDVVDTPWAARTDAGGRATLTGLPTGPVRIDVWHPYLRAPGNMMTRAVPLGAAPRRESFTVGLRAPPRAAAQSDY